MTELEYLQKRCAISENVLDALIREVGYALPHLQNRLGSMMDAWGDVLDKLDAEKKASET